MASSSWIECTSTVAAPWLSRDERLFPSMPDVEGRPLVNSSSDITAVDVVAVAE